MDVNEIGRTPPTTGSYLHNAIKIPQARLGHNRCDERSLPFDKTNQFLLEVTLPPRSFQIFDAPKVIHDVFRLAEVNLEVEANKKKRQGQISCVPRLIN